MNKLRYCKNCKHWKKDTRGEGNYCIRVVTWEGKTPNKWHKNQKNKMFGIEYFVHDDSGLKLYLKTGPDFGCNHFGEKNV